MLSLQAAPLRVGGWPSSRRATAVGAAAAARAPSPLLRACATARPNGASSFGWRQHSSLPTLSTRTAGSCFPRFSPTAAAAAADSPGPLGGSSSSSSSSSSEETEEGKTAAAPAAAATPPPAPLLLVRRLAASPSLSSGRALLLAAASSLSRSFWPILLVHSLASCATFLVHRLSHRATNAAALLLLPALRGSSPAATGPALSALSASEAIMANPWWLCPDPAVASFATGYQWVVLALFVGAFPLTVAARAWAAAATAFLCLREEEARGGRGAGEGARAGSSPPRPSASASPSPSPSPCSSAFELPPLLPPVRETLAAVRAVSPRVAEAFARTWAAELLVAARAVPLQALSLPLLPLPWTLPRLLDLQVAPVVAAVEGRGGRGAIERAAELSSGGSGGGGEAAAAAGAEAAALPGGRKKGRLSFASLPFVLAPSRRRAALAWPFIVLLVSPRLLAAAKEAALAALSPRMAAALPEVPLVLAAVGGVGGVILARLSDVLPFVAWRWFVGEEEKEKEAGGGKKRG